MKTNTNLAADPIAGEEDLLQRIQRLHKRDDKSCIGRIGIKNAAGHIRLAVYVFTDAELDGVTALLENRQFTDELNKVVEHEEDGNVEVEVVQVEHPDFEYIYSPTGSMVH